MCAYLTAVLDTILWKRLTHFQQKNRKLNYFDVLAGYRLIDLDGPQGICLFDVKVLLGTGGEGDEFIAWKF